MSKAQVKQRIEVLDDGRGRFARTIPVGEYELQELPARMQRAYLVQKGACRFEVTAAELAAWAESGKVQVSDR